MTTDRIVVPDPVAEPEAYQKALLDLLGDRDPEEVLSRTPELFAELTDELTPAQLRQAPAPGEWSVEELLAHYFTAEVVYSFRWRLTLTQPGTRYPGYDQEKWAALPLPPYPELLGAFASLRRTNVQLIEETPTDEWDKAAVHEERGEESFGLAVSLLGGHDIAHLRQLEQTVAAITG
jgi:hypothetical protein